MMLLEFLVNHSVKLFAKEHLGSVSQPLFLGTC